MICNISAVDRIYNSLTSRNDCDDLPETEEARRKLKAYWVFDYFQGDTEEAYKQWLNLEGYIGNLAMFNERQGFIYGFNYAMELFVSGEKRYDTKKLDNIVKEEYSTLTVEQIDKLGKTVDVLKEYVPENKFNDVIDTLCACVEETKFLTFEQGFIRGIAAVKGGVDYGR